MSSGQRIVRTMGVVVIPCGEFMPCRVLCSAPSSRNCISDTWICRIQAMGQPHLAIPPRAVKHIRRPRRHRQERNAQQKTRKVTQAFRTRRPSRPSPSEMTTATGDVHILTTRCNIFPINFPQSCFTLPSTVLCYHPTKQRSV